MRLLRVLGYRLRSLVSGDRLDDEAREEIAAHLERQIAANRATGMSDDEARRAALLEVGRVPQLGEECRDARGLAWWDALRSDTRYALRQMRKRPGFSAAAVVTLALGVGATAAVFAVVDAVLLRPLPYTAPDRLYTLYEINARGNVGRTRATALNFLDWQQQASSFSGMAAHVGTGFTLTGRGEPEFALGQLVTPGLLDVLGVQPMLGRGFQPHETEAGRNRVVILTHALWMRHFGGDPSVVGRPSSINGQPYLVIGVMPPSFTYPAETYQLMTPLVTKGNVSDGPPISRSARYLRVVARLRDGVREESAREELAVIGKRLSDTYSDSNANVTIGMAGLAEDMTAGARKNLVIVLVAVGFVLLIACVNVAGLTIARGSARGRELSVRAAIGASRGRLVRQLATEGLVLFVIGGALGLTLAAWGVAALASELPASLPRAPEISVDWRFLAFGAALTLTSGLLFSVLPALSIARRGPASVPGRRARDRFGGPRRPAHARHSDRCADRGGSRSACRRRARTSQLRPGAQSRQRFRNRPDDDVRFRDARSRVSSGRAHEGICRQDRGGASGRAGCRSRGPHDASAAGRQQSRKHLYCRRFARRGRTGSADCGRARRERPLSRPRSEPGCCRGATCCPVTQSGRSRWSSSPLISQIDTCVARARSECA